MRLILSLLLAIGLAPPALAGDTIPARPGWAVHPTQLTYDDLRARMPAAIKSQGMGKVTEAGPTAVAAKRGIKIPGSRIYGILNNNFAVRTIRTSVSAMIEAPVRMCVTSNPDGKATLSYKLPSAVFAPYYAEGGEDLRAIAAELDAIFAAIAAEALGG